MTEWEVIGVIVTLLGLLGAVIPTFTKLTKAITKLTVVVELLGKDVETTKAHNDEQDKMLNDHETRIQLLEKAG